MNHQQRFSLEGKVALVTGSTKGLGRAMALALGQAGAKVAINYCHDESKAQATLQQFQEAGCTGMNEIGGSVNSVNGSVEIGAESSIRRDLGLVNGTIKVLGAQIDGDVSIRNGKIEIKGNSVVAGDLRIEHTSDWSDKKKALHIYLQDQAIVKGNIVVEDPGRAVLLHLSGDAKVEGHTEHVTLAED